MAKCPATKLSLDYLRGQGFLSEVVERMIPSKPFPKKKDLFDFVDIVSIQNDNVVFIQTTSTSNKSARIRKIEQRDIATKFYEVHRAARVHLHCWKKVGRTYEVTVYDLDCVYGPDQKDHVNPVPYAGPTMADVRARMRRAKNELHGG
jgi:hypothetical protein